MNNKKALNIALSTNPFMWGADGASKGEYLECILDTLEKQTPKAPKVEKYFYGKYYLCPSCGQNVKEGECCRNNECGQLLNWESVE